MAEFIAAVPFIRKKNFCWNMLQKSRETILPKKKKGFQDYNNGFLN